MSVITVKLPDVGEGVAEAELVEWHVTTGDVVREDDILVAVMTDKATVEIPAPSSGKVTWLAAKIGDSIAVGSELAKIDTGTGEGEQGKPAEKDETNPDSEETEKTSSPSPLEQEPEAEAVVPAAQNSRPVEKKADQKHDKESLPRPPKPIASPAVRLRARETGIDLRQVPGTGAAGRITHDDLADFMEHGRTRPEESHLQRDESVTEINIVGLRRKIAERMAISYSNIPHITIVEEIDVTETEKLRALLNEKPDRDRSVKLTLLPFIISAMVEAVREQPQFNAHYNTETQILTRYGGVHVGIATQTKNGLLVPVLRHAEALGLTQKAEEIAALTEKTRSGKANREELGGSTITISSLGALGAIATTPIINHPEVAIVGVNKIAMRPVWAEGQFVPRKIMNLSCSFDHRVIDGWDAAMFVRKLKTLLENPAAMFVKD